MFLPGQIKRNKFVVLKDGRKMFIDDVDYGGSNNPFGHFAVHVVEERGSTKGEWVTGEQIVRVVSDPIQRPPVIDMGPLAYNRPTKQKTMNENIKQFIRRVAGVMTERKLRENTDVANTILQQMGGAGRLKAFLGVKQFVASPDGVSFRWPNPRRTVGNGCKITLKGDDTYTMEFFNNASLVKAYGGLYFDQLIPVFEKQTGWYLRLREAVDKEASEYWHIAPESKGKWEVVLSIGPERNLGGQKMKGGFSSPEEAKSWVKKTFKMVGTPKFVSHNTTNSQHYTDWVKANTVKEAALDPQARATKPIKMVTCKLCRGTGSYNGLECGNCHGKGQHPELRKDVDEYKRYSGDPFWLTAKYGKCKECGADLSGKKAFYYPKNKSAYCEKCGEKRSNEFDASASDEDAYNAQYESMNFWGNVHGDYSDTTDIMLDWRGKKQYVDVHFEVHWGSSAYTLTIVINYVKLKNGQDITKLLSKSQMRDIEDEIKEEVRANDTNESKVIKARGRWMPTKISKPPKKGKGASYNRQQFKKSNESLGWERGHAHLRVIKPNEIKSKSFLKRLYDERENAIHNLITTSGMRGKDGSLSQSGLDFLKKTVSGYIAFELNMGVNIAQQSVDALQPQDWVTIYQGLKQIFYR